MEKEFEEVELIRKRKNNKEEKKKKSIFLILFNRRKNSRMTLLLIALFVTGVLLSGSTYAWFTANYTVSVSPIDVNVAASQGIQISTNAVTWKAMVNTTELVGSDVNALGMTAYDGNANQIPSSTSQLTPVSTVKSVTNDRLTMYSGVIDDDVTTGDYVLATAEVPAPTGVADGGASTRLTGSYIVFDLFVRSDFAESKQLYFTDDTSIIGVSNDTGIQNATRVAILLLGNTPSTSTSAEMVALTGGTGLEAQGSFGADVPQVYFWEPNYEMHVPTGYNNAVGEYGYETTLFSYNASGYYTTTDPLGYSGVKGVVTSGENGDNIPLGQANATREPNKFEVVDIDYATLSTNDVQTEIFTLQPGVTKMRIYMWVEGQDVDCENGESGGDIRFTLQFEVNQ